MKVDGEERRGFVEGGLSRGAQRREACHAQGEDFVCAGSGEVAAAHERAVITVKLTLLLLAAGIILLLFNGLGGASAAGQRSGCLIERLK